MIVLLVFLILCYGLTNAMVFGSAFQGWRDLCYKLSPKWLYKLFTCPMCLGAWWGFAISLIFILYGASTPITDLGIDNIPLAVFFNGMLASGGVWLMHTVQEYFERAYNEE